jgi:chromosome partitioning protein
MSVIVVANPKGGVGKSTLATNVAGALAQAGHAVMLGDVDRQQSSRQWLALRPPQLPLIRNWEVSHNDIVRPPKGTTHVVLDTPAGLHGKRLDAVLKIADRVLIPLQCEYYAIQATHGFVQALQAHKRAPSIRAALVAMRVREHTISFDQLRHYLSTLPLPVLTALRDTQRYVQLAARGLTLWDVAPGRVEQDRAQWAALLQWLDGGAETKATAATTATTATVTAR